MKSIISLLFAVSSGLLVSLPALAAGGGHLYPDDPANIKLTNTAALQHGAKLYVNYCLGCHTMQYQRWSRLAEDLQLSDDVVLDNLVFGDQKIGDTMSNAMPAAYAANWFGTNPPDLTLEVRSRGEDWVYNYLRAFYKDESRPYGVNNTVFPDVGMPHVLAPLQGVQVLTDDLSAGGHLELVEEGTLSAEEYDESIRDLVAFMSYAAEPMKLKRESLGLKVIIFLLLFGAIAWFLKKEYWKDIH